MGLEISKSLSFIPLNSPLEPCNLCGMAEIDQKAVTADQMRALDRRAIGEFGIPGLILMENAGRGIADLAQKILKNRKRIIVICGKGNNGGDGFVAARHLTNRGYKVDVILLANPDELKNDPKINFRILKSMRVPIKIVTSNKNFSSVLKNSDLIIDAIFGIGLSRPVTGLFYDVISMLNESKKPVLSIDVPSGLNSDSGKVMGIAVRAKVTGTLGMAKRGLFVQKGPKLSGRVQVLDISIPINLL